MNQSILLQIVILSKDKKHKQTSGTRSHGGEIDGEMEVRKIQFLSRKLHSLVMLS